MRRTGGGNHLETCEAGNLQRRGGCQGTRFKAVLFPVDRALLLEGWGHVIPYIPASEGRVLLTRFEFNNSLLL